MLTENERLTHRRASGWGWSQRSGCSEYWSAATKTALMERLAAYEDTGLTPEEVEQMKTPFEWRVKEEQ